MQRKNINYADFELYIRTIDGRKKKIALNWIKLEITVGVRDSYMQHGWKVILPSQWDRSEVYILQFTPYGMRCYLMNHESSDGSFLLNGNHCVDAYFSAYDRLEFSGNILVVLPSKCKKIVRLNWRPEHWYPRFIFGDRGTGKKYAVEEFLSHSKLKPRAIWLDMAKNDMEQLDHYHLEKDIVIIKFFENCSVEQQEKLLALMVSKQCKFILLAHRSLHDLFKNNLLIKELYNFLIAYAMIDEFIPLRGQKWLIQHICEEFMVEYKCNIEESLLEFYKSYSWPGNIAQLQRHLQRKLLSTDKRLLFYDQFEAQLGLETFMWQQEHVGTLKEMKRRYIQHVYQITHGDRVQTLNLLGISYPTLKANLP